MSCLPRKKRNAAMLIRDIDRERLIIHVQQVEGDKLRDRDEYRNKKSKTIRNDSKY